jgi:hypothetical protein
VVHSHARRLDLLLTHEDRRREAPNLYAGNDQEALADIGQGAPTSGTRDGSCPVAGPLEEGSLPETGHIRHIA